MATEFHAYLFRIVLVVLVLEGIVTGVVLVGSEHQCLLLILLRLGTAILTVEEFLPRRLLAPLWHPSQSGSNH